MAKALVKSLYRETSTYMGTEVEISGWVRKIRVSKGFGFIEINDGSFFKGVQVVFDESLANFDEISRVSIASSLIIKGIVVESQGAGQIL